MQMLLACLASSARGTRRRVRWELVKHLERGHR